MFVFLFCFWFFVVVFSCSFMSLFLLVFVVFQVFKSSLHCSMANLTFLLKHTLVTIVTKDRVQDDPILVSSKQLRCLIDCIT